jgi:hypothetical protein
MPMGGRVLSWDLKKALDSVILWNIYSGNTSKEAPLA